MSSNYYGDDDDDGQINVINEAKVGNIPENKEEGNQ